MVPTPDVLAGMVAAAVLGVLATLGSLFALMARMDSHFVTRREYKATLDAIHDDLREIKASLGAGRH